MWSGKMRAWLLVGLFLVLVASPFATLQCEVKSSYLIFDHYHSYDEIVNYLLYLNASYSQFVDVFAIGSSIENRTIYAAKITDESVITAKTNLLIVGYHHAREPISAELAIYFIDWLLFGTNNTVAPQLKEVAVFVVPALNVDGFNSSAVNDWQRKNSRPIDEDHDGVCDEDPPCDVNGDGFVGALYANNGTFIRWEGNDTDGDGNLDWAGGVDLNRNYSFKWNATVQSGSNDPTAEDYRGTAPFSEPETQAIRNLVQKYYFSFAVSLHSGTKLVLYPWAYTSDRARDFELLENMSARIGELVSAPHMQSANLYTSSGDFADWIYSTQGTLAFTFEVYGDSSAWHYLPGPVNDTFWQVGIKRAFSPSPEQISTVCEGWLPGLVEVLNTAAEKIHTEVNIRFYDVGQGDSEFIETSGMNVLIDGGSAQNASVLLNYLNELNITHIDLMIATHPHEDHVGGLVAVLNSIITVSQILFNNQSYSSQSYQQFLALAQNHVLSVACRGQTIPLSETAQLVILNPVQPLEFSNVNDNSVVARLDVLNVSVLFTGDAEADAEQSMLNAGLNVSSRVLKVGHHGSRTATSQQFLDAMNPSIAVISARINNTYGHPHAETIDRLLAKGVVIYGTYVSGTITMFTDGFEVNVADSPEPIIPEFPSFLWIPILMAAYSLLILLSIRLGRRRGFLLFFRVLGNS